LLHKFLITVGEHEGQLLNALESATTADLLYFACEQTGEQVAQQLAAQMKLENKNYKKKQNLAAKTTPPADPRFRAFVELAQAAFRAKYGVTPTWQGKDWKSLQNLLASNKALSLDDLQSRWRNYLQSADTFTANQGGSLAYFCAHADAFISGPISFPSKGALNGKPNLADAVETTLSSHVRFEGTPN
jgi:hypothetical protein